MTRIQRRRAADADHPGLFDGPAADEAMPGDNRLREPLSAAFERVAPAWRAVTDAFVASDAGRDLMRFVDRRIGEGAIVYPKNVFRALELTDPSAVRVVILGQDPYHGPGQAQGLAFSVAAGQKLPPSLRNMLQEVRDDIGVPSQCGGDLSAWARQGVLLLNAALTVEAGEPQSHAGRGWERLTEALIEHVAAQPETIVFLLWGAAAQQRQRALSMHPQHRVLTANHPSPLSARRPPEPFLGCRHFSQVNRLLAQLRPGTPPIRW